MENVFLHLVNMSITAGWLVLAVVVLRLVFRRAPKWIHCLLWVLVGVRLICPFSIESVLSLIPSAETVPVDTFLYETPTIQSGVPVVDAVVNPVLSESFAPQPMASVNPMQVLSILAAYAWAVGMTLMLVYALVTTLRLKWRVRESVRLQRNIYQCDRIATPFILGVIRPRIYLPTTLTEQDILSVVAHEEAHIRRKDHWWKPLGFLLLTVYWFNPLLWLGYVLLCRDIEAACDQRVIRDMDVDQRKAYSETLLACSAPRHLITACPLAFGETGVKSRIKAVLNYKKPAFWLIVVAVIASIAVAVCLLTNPKEAVSDELDAYLTHVILEENQSDHTGDAYPTEAHTVLGVEEKDGKTVVYTMVLYEEYYLDANGALQVQSASHIPTVITVDMEGNGYSLVEYWIPRDGTDYATDIRAKYPVWYWWQTDTQRHIDKHQQKTLADAEEHFNLNEEPYSEPIASMFSVSQVHGNMWMPDETLEELYKGLPEDTDTQWLPVVPITTTEELDAFIQKYFVPAGKSAHHLQDAYTDTFFAHNVLLAVYYMSGTCSEDPRIVALDYTDNGTTLQLLVDVYTPLGCDAGMGYWFMMCTVPYTSLNNAIKYTAVVRGHVPADVYAAAFDIAVSDPAKAVEVWRDWLGYEEQTYLYSLMDSGKWMDGATIDIRPVTYQGAFNINGITCYVSEDCTMVYDGNRYYETTAEEQKFFVELFRPRSDSTCVPPYQAEDTTVSTAQKTTATQKVDGDADTFVGKVTQVTGTAMLMECYDTDQFALAWVSFKNHPDLNPQVGDEYVITHDGMVKETYPVQVTAVVITPVSSTPTVDPNDEKNTTTTTTTTTTKQTTASTTSKPTATTKPPVPAEGEFAGWRGDTLVVNSSLSADVDELQVLAVKSLEEMNDLLGKYSFDEKETMVKTYNSAYFEQNILLLTRYVHSTCNVEPRVVDVRYGDDKNSLRVWLDVYEPYMQSPAFGSWLLATSVDRAAAANITTYDAYVRGSVLLSYFVAPYENAPAWATIKSAPEKWRDSLGEESFELDKVLDRLSWSDLGTKANGHTFAGTFNLHNVNYYVSSDYALVCTEKQVAYLTKKDGDVFRALFQPRDNLRYLPPYWTQLSETIQNSKHKPVKRNCWHTFSQPMLRSDAAAITGGYTLKESDVQKLEALVDQVKWKVEPDQYADSLFDAYFSFDGSRRHYVYWNAGKGSFITNGMGYYAVLTKEQCKIIEKLMAGGA